MATDGTFDVLPKKEVSLLKKQQDKLEKFLGGIEDMPRIPDVLFIVDQGEDQEDDQEQQPAADKKADSMEDIVEAVEGDNKRAN